MSASTATSTSPMKRRLSLAKGACTNVLKATMKRFVTKKRVNKKAAAEPKLEIDLSQALPSTDNFRTSLLMPGLSTRFSMLREQDDPRSMLGKASDDSVLMPNRRSRLYDFGYNPSHLDNIAEVSSIAGSIKPSFNPGRRQDSFASVDGYGTDDDSLRSGSIMTRARPGEGNNLFGGRQKVFKIPVGAQSERSLSGSSKGGMGGRAMYEDDINLSSFQQLKQQERERREQELRAAQGLDYESPPKASTPPSLSNYNNKRETSSSTTSGQNARTSTAATSINSQGASAIPTSPGLVHGSSNLNSQGVGLDRSGTKAKRLYDQGLDKEIQVQQLNTLNRLNSVQKGRNGIGAPPMALSKSASSFQDRGQRSPIDRDSPTVPHAFSSFNSPENGPYGGDSRPISPIGSDFEEHSILSASIDPSDRGKATAMGAFSKPKPYTEAEYIQRQKLMQQGRSTPTLGRDTPTLPQEPSKLVKPAGSAVVHPEAARPDSDVQSPFNVFHNAAMQNVRAIEPAPLSPPGNGRSFLHSPAPGDSESEAESRSRSPPAAKQFVKRADIPNARLAPPPAPNGHPAFRPSSPLSQPGQAVAGPIASDVNHALTVDGQWETSPPRRNSPSGPGLSGLVRQHLRSGSDKSSLYEFPGSENGAAAHGRPTFGYGQGAPQAYDAAPRPSVSSSNPWDLDETESNRFSEGGAQAGAGAADPNARFASPRSKADMPGGLNPMPEADEAPWEERMKREHARDISVETTGDGTAFASDLAEKQRAIQKKLKNNNEQRSSSPTPTKNGFKNMLRTKASYDSVADRDNQLRGKKTPSGSATNLPSLTSRGSDEDRVARGKYGVPIPPDPEDTTAGYDIRAGNRDRSLSRSTKGRSPTASARNSDATTRNRSDSDLSAPGGRSRSRSTRYKDDLDKAMAEGTSSRTNSMYPDSVYSTAEVLDEHPMPPPVHQLQTQYSSPRLRSNSRTNSPAVPQTLWEQNNGLHPAMRTMSAAGLSPQGAPGLGMSNLDTGVPNFSARPSPNSAVSPAFSPAGRSPILNQGAYSANNTPPVSGTNTPIYPPTTFNAMQSSIVQQQIPPGATRGGPQSRKRSVNKHEISEPTLISMTSVVDTVALPPGASLKNGLEETVPPVPAINPRRKKFGFGRSSDNTPAPSNVPSPTSHSPPRPQQTSVFEEDEPASNRHRSRSRSRLRKQSSDGKGLSERAMRERERELEQERSMPQVLHHAVGSPPIVMTEGGMF